MVEEGQQCSDWRHESQGCLSSRDGVLYVDECSAELLVDRFGTPLYVVSEQQLRRRFQEIRRCFREAWPEGEVKILASIKANYSLALRRILTLEGAGCDTFGASELAAAVTCGVPGEDISVNGTGKTDGLINAAVGLGATITVDSARELDLVLRAAPFHRKRAAVRFRLRPDFSELTQVSDFFPDMSIAAAASRYKPGIPADDATSVLRAALASPHVDVLGCHVHLGRHSGSLEVWRGMLRAYAKAIAALRDACEGWEPKELDVGGGFPSPGDAVGRGHTGNVGDSIGRAGSTYREYAQAVAETLRTELGHHGIGTNGRVLLVEPGRALYADIGIHLTKILSIKCESTRTPTTWIETDTSEAFLPDVNLEQCRWPCVLASHASHGGDRTYDVMGVSCGFDVLSEGVTLPEAAPGDVLAFLFTGAYQDAGAGNFNAMPRPATVLVNGCEAEIVKRAETAADVFARDAVPDRLGGPLALRSLDSLVDPR